MKKRLKKNDLNQQRGLPITVSLLAASCLVVTSGSAGEIIYQNDFSSAQTIKPMCNALTNYVGTAMAEDMNFGE